MPLPAVSTRAGASTRVAPIFRGANIRGASTADLHYPRLHQCCHHSLLWGLQRRQSSSTHTSATPSALSKTLWGDGCHMQNTNGTAGGRVMTLPAFSLRFSGTMAEFGADLQAPPASKLSRIIGYVDLSITTSICMESAPCSTAQSLHFHEPSAGPPFNLHEKYAHEDDGSHISSDRDISVRHHEMELFNGTVVMQLRGIVLPSTLPTSLRRISTNMLHSSSHGHRFPRSVALSLSSPHHLSHSQYDDMTDLPNIRETYFPFFRRCIRAATRSFWTI
jgi:hypothetical protein